MPGQDETSAVIRKLGRDIGFSRHSNEVILKGEVSQEEFSFLLHNLNCPLKASVVRMQNLYNGDILKGQRKIKAGGKMALE